MKNLIINIYKTLFFFDFAIVVAYYIPNIKTESTALLQLWREGIFLAVTLLFTVLFITLVEKRKLKVFNFKNKFRHYSLGMLTAVIPLGVTVLAMFIFKLVSFSGVNKTKNILLWIAALLLNAAANELLLRGYLFRLYRKHYGITAVTVVITLLFISLNPYMFKGGIIYSANMLVFNILLCFLAEYSHSLLAPVTAHFVYNAVSTLLLGSYKPTEEYPAVINAVFSGKKYLSGGAMKLEGSVILLALNIAVGVYFVLKLKKRRTQN